MTIALKVSVLPEPYLQFGDGNEHHEPRTGLTQSGPFSLRYGNDIPGSVRLGFIGTPELLDAGRTWFQRCQEGIQTKKSNRRRTRISRHSKKYSEPNSTSKTAGPWN